MASDAPQIAAHASSTHGPKPQATPLDTEALIHKYYADNAPLEQLLLRHSRDVARRALQIVHSHPEWKLDEQFVFEAAMLHDIGIFLTDAPGIHCHGTQPYICHGQLGGTLLRQEHLPRHARVAERHTGTGLTAEDIRRQGLPLPPQDFVPETLEEEIICYADKFYSKSRPEQEKSPEQALRSIAKFGPDGEQKFRQWMKIFEP